MAADDRDVLKTLIAELEFLEKGGYRRSTESPGRARFVFEDSPTCPNYGRKHDLVSCKDGVLIQFVPPHSRNEKFPCRHIPLNTAGYTVDTFYRLGTKEVLGIWLRKTIYQLERARAEQNEGQKAAKTKTSMAGGF